jgi:hypothetical protein
VLRIRSSFEINTFLGFECDVAAVEKGIMHEAPAGKNTRGTGTAFILAPRALISRAIVCCSERVSDALICGVLGWNYMQRTPGAIHHPEQHLERNISFSDPAHPKKYPSAAFSYIYI